MNPFFSGIFIVFGSIAVIVGIAWGIDHYLGKHGEVQTRRLRNKRRKGKG